MSPTRLPHAASTLDDVVRYFVDRARQGLIENWEWSGLISPVRTDGVVWGARTLTRNADGEEHQSLYVLDDHTGKGHFTRYIASEPRPIVTAPSCEIEALLDSRGIPYSVAGRFNETPEYLAVSSFYGEQRARRSGAHYMNHIDEGLGVMAHFGASDAAMRAYCLHPLVQMDADLRANAPRIGELASTTYVAVLAVEYRNIANAHLSAREEEQPGAPIALSPLEEVNDMLRADKVQNYKDFLLYHADSHPRRAVLERYFRRWLERLEISDAEFDELRRRIDVDAQARLGEPLDIR